ncbi:chemotaxis protein CheW [Niveispirillum sp. KHB5.9]|uniref:chemotaxis protein CheW n=1 Tax=Niveispirillum sp. KHB5.9 TaxID=3400269 RepID=UPI003A8B4E65
MDAVRAAEAATAETMVDLLLFTLDGRPYAVRLGQVERVVSIAAFTPLPGAPSVVAGVINIGGRFLPVLDVRARLGSAARPPRLEDGLVVVRLASRSVALWIDRVEGTIHLPADRLVPADSVVPAGGWFDAVTALPGGPVFIHDADRFLSMDEEAVLDQALARGVPS